MHESPASSTSDARSDSPPAAPDACANELDYFAEDERAAQLRFREVRDRALAPLVRLCRWLGVTADHVSLLALAALIPFAAGLWFGPAAWGPLLAVGSLALHVLLDGLDGPVARAEGSAGPAGAFTDMCFDHAGFLVVCVLLAASGRLDGAAACAYVSTYTFAIAMVVALNLLRRPLRFVVRTKYLFYALFAMKELTGLDVLTSAAVVFSAVHLGFALLGFRAARDALR